MAFLRTPGGSGPCHPCGAGHWRRLLGSILGGTEGPNPHRLQQQQSLSLYRGERVGRRLRSLRRTRRAERALLLQQTRLREPDAVQRHSADGTEPDQRPRQARVHLRVRSDVLVRDGDVRHAVVSRARQLVRARQQCQHRESGKEPVSPRCRLHGAPVLSAGIRAAVERLQLLGNAVVRRAHHRQPRSELAHRRAVERNLREPRRRGVRQLRVSDAQRHTAGSTEPGAVHPGGVRQPEPREGGIPQSGRPLHPDDA
jgi:hypothetical protein